MMTHEAMRAFLGGFQAFRALGFRASDIYFSVNPSAQHRGRLSIFCVLKTQNKTFNLECAFVEDPKEAEEEYICVARAMAANEISEEDRMRIWQESEPYARKVDFVLAVINKGFELPGGSSN